MNKRKSVDRLLAKVSVCADTGCWNWTGSRTCGGYGEVRRNGKLRVAHRIHWEDHRGAIPDGLLVCHRCDNRLCINLDHLFLGTPAENVADMYAKGRQAPARGSDCGAAKLTEADVIAIRAVEGLTPREIAQQYGVSRRHIARLRAGEGWSHIR